MKKFLLFVAVFAFVGTTAQAQCTKSKTAAHTSKKACTKAKTASLVDAPAKVCSKAADAAMMQDHSIVKKVSDQGDVSYARKKTCAASGKVSYADVKYCDKSQAFVNVAPVVEDATAITVAGAEKKVCSKAATAAMMQDLSIVKKVSDQGDVSYARKKTCAASGKVSYEDVKYCSKSQAFVNAAPADAMQVSGTKKTCTAAEKAACSKAVAAALVANPDVEKKTCAASGKVSYMQKKTCAASGKVSYDEVKYCSKSKAFVNAAPVADDAMAVHVAGAEKKVCSKAVAAALVANPDVEKKTCAASGKVSYMQKKTCATSGKVSYNEVKYCSDSKAFVNAAPAKKSCTAAEKAACSKKASLNADGTKKSCAKTCTKGKKASLKKASTEGVKVIKTSNQ